MLDAHAEAVGLDADEVKTLFMGTEGLEAATVSACVSCRARVLATVAFAELLSAGPPLASGAALAELAEDAPTLHLYVVDEARQCRHRTWRDPGHDEWVEVVPADAGARPGSRRRPGFS